MPGDPREEMVGDLFVEAAVNELNGFRASYLREAVVRMLGEERLACIDPAHIHGGPQLAMSE